MFLEVFSNLDDSAVPINYHCHGPHTLQLHVIDIPRDNF